MTHEEHLDSVLVELGDQVAYLFEQAVERNFTDELDRCLEMNIVMHNLSNIMEHVIATRKMLQLSGTTL